MPHLTPTQKQLAQELTNVYGYIDSRDISRLLKELVDARTSLIIGNFSVPASERKQQAGDMELASLGKRKPFQFDKTAHLSSLGFAYLYEIKNIYQDLVLYLKDELITRLTYAGLDDKNWDKKGSGLFSAKTPDGIKQLRDYAAIIKDYKSGDGIPDPDSKDPLEAAIEISILLDEKIKNPSKTRNPAVQELYERLNQSINHCPEMPPMPDVTKK